MNIRDLTEYLNNRFPIELQEKYDNTGDQVSFTEKSINNILLAVDIEEKIIAEALEKNCNIIITHHPFLFKPLKKIKTGEPYSDYLLSLIRNEISLYAVHTNMDKIFFDKLGRVLGINDGKLLLKTDTMDNIDYGFGFYGKLTEEIMLDDLLKLIKDKLSLSYLQYTGEKTSPVRNVALINGAGGGQIENIILNNNVDCIVTGDVGYHHFKTAQIYGIPVIDAGHFGTERILLDFLKDEIDEYLKKNNLEQSIKIYISQYEENPVKIFI